jgi:carbamoyl-phosphate synthase large subunit
LFRSRSSEARRPPVLVVQIGWRTGPVAGRSLVRAGFHVVGGHEHARLIGRTRYCRTRVRYPSPALDPDGFVDALARISKRYGVRALLPLDDDVVDILARRSHALGAIVVGPTASQFRALCDKRHLGETAVQVGLGIPERAFVGRAGREQEWPLLPSLVKPRATSLATAHLSARKPTLVHTRAERDRAVRDLVREGVDVVVEEQVRGPAWRVHFVRARDGIALLALHSVRSFPEQTGQSSVQTVALKGGPSKLVAGAVRLLDLVDYRGPGSIQAFERDGEIVVHDVNLRLPITVAVTIRAGLDMPRLAVETALGEPLRAPAHLVPATYVGLDEFRHLVATVRRRDVVTPAREIAADLWRGFVRRDFVLDQVDVMDPVPTLLAARGLGLNLRRDWVERA